MLNIYNNLDGCSYPILNSNSDLIAKPCIISEKALFNLIEQFYKEKNIDKVIDLYKIYKNYKYEKNLERIKQFLVN